MKPTKVLTLVLILLLMWQCQKDAPTPYGEGKGKAIFYLSENCQVGGIMTFYVNGNQVGTSNKYFPQAVNCDDKDVVSYIGDAGTHKLDVKTGFGDVASYTFNIESGQCFKYPITCAEVQGNQPPANYRKQGVITVRSRNISLCARDWGTIDGDIITLQFNGHAFATNLTLTGQNRCWTFRDLPSGTNWLGLIAINQGTIGSASPRIEINDGFSTQSFEFEAYINQPGAYTIRVVL